MFSFTRKGDSWHWIDYVVAQLIRGLVSVAQYFVRFRDIFQPSPIFPIYHNEGTRPYSNPRSTRMGPILARDRRGWRILFARIERQYFKVVSIMLFISILGFYFREHIPFVGGHQHAISTSDLQFEASISSDASKQILIDKNGFLEEDSAERYCAAHKWKPFPLRDSRRKVYDLFLVNSELDWLEIRLNELKDHVDYFVILESPKTFTNLPKPLIVQENWAKFKQFSDQIIYHVLEDDPPLKSDRSWDHEIFQRNAMFTQVIPKLTGAKKANLGDVILVSDIDEVPRPATLTLLRNCDFPLRLTLRSRFYYYGFQWLHRGQEWAHPQATTYLGADDTILPQDLRGGHHAPWFGSGKADLWNAAWHCSSCFATIEEMLLKMKSFSHVEYNEERFREKKRIVEYIRKGKDLWDRWGQWYDRVDKNEDVPAYLKKEGMGERFGYMLDRDGPNAGFVDYKPDEDA